MRFRLILAIAIAVLLWASSFAVIRSAVREFPPGAMALFRFSVASLVLFFYCLMTRQFRLPDRKQILPAVACGFLGITLYHPLLNYGEQTVAAGAASLLLNSAPLWTTLLAIPFLGERLTPRKILGVCVGFVGIVLITLGKPDPTGHYFQLKPASLAIIGSAIATSFYVIFQKKFLERATALQFTSWSIWSGSLLLAPVFAHQLIVTFPKASTQSLAEVTYLGIFPAALAYLTFAYATQHLHAARVMSFLYLVPPLAMIIAWPYLHEWPTALSLCGGALAIAGVAIVNTAGRQPPIPPTAVEEG